MHSLESAPRRLSRINTTILSSMVDHADSNGMVIQLHQKVIAEETYYSLSAVKRAMKDLTQKGLIGVVQKGNRETGPSTYMLNRTLIDWFVAPVSQ